MSQNHIEQSKQSLLSNSEKIFKIIIETASVGIIIIDQQGEIVLVNAKTEELFGYEREELIGQKLEMLLPPPLRTRHVTHRANYLSEPHIRSMGVGQDLVALHKDGHEFPIETALSSIQTEQGLLMVSFISDISRRKQAEERERQVKERTREIEQRREVAEGLRELLTVLNSNRPLEEILEEIITLATRLLASDATALFRVHTKRLRIATASGLSANYMTQIELPLGQGVVGKAVSQRQAIATTDLMSFLKNSSLQKDSRQWALLTELANQYSSLLAIPLIIKNEVYGSLVLYYTKQKDFCEEDIELAKAFCDQASLAIENARLRAQVKESAITAERNRLARDLHDAVTQTLFSASLIAEVLPRLWEIKPEEGQKRLQELRELTRGALAEMRTLLFELRPTVLIKTALPDLFRQLGEATTSRARIPVDVTIEGNHQLPPDVQVALYRIAQEALNNVAKHSSANQASVTLRIESFNNKIQVLLEICDNGRGFVLADVAPERLGLDIMQERADDIGAILKIKSQLGQGTEIMVTWQGV